MRHRLPNGNLSYRRSDPQQVFITLLLLASVFGILISILYWG